jgi:hypothetical protein
MTPKEPGAFFITSTLDSKNAERTVEEITDELERLAFEGPDSGDNRRDRKARLRGA